MCVCDQGYFCFALQRQSSAHMNLYKNPAPKSGGGSTEKLGRQHARNLNQKRERKKKVLPLVCLLGHVVRMRKRRPSPTISLLGIVTTHTHTYMETFRMSPFATHTPSRTPLFLLLFTRLVAWIPVHPHHLIVGKSWRRGWSYSPLAMTWGN